MSTTNTDAYDLKSVDWEGVLHEDVMEKLARISPKETPYMESVDRLSSGNPYKSWVKESLASPDQTNALVDGDDAPSPRVSDEARVGNHHQISGKTISVSKRARNVNTIGYANRLAHETMLGQMELKRDMEAILLSNQGSVEGTDTIAGKLAGCGAMFETNVMNGTPGGFSAGIYSPPTPGAAAALTEVMLLDAAEMAYTEGGNPNVIMSIPKMIRRLSTFLMDGARGSTIMRTGGDVKENRYGKMGVEQVNSVSTFTSDFDTFSLVPNRQQQMYDNGGTNCVNIYLFDPDYWGVSYIYGIEADELAVNGLAATRMLSVDYTNVSLQEKASAVIMGIDPTLPMAAN
jgi:hypothetical protein